eukprot:scaffold407890_cov41-Prasinocladus_malaysianus.AAC.1
MSFARQFCSRAYKLCARNPQELQTFSCLRHPIPRSPYTRDTMAALAKAPLAKGAFVGQTAQLKPRAQAQAPLRAALNVRAEAE